MMNDKNTEPFSKNKWFRLVGLGIVVLINIGLGVILFRNFLVSEKNPEVNRPEVLSEVERRPAPGPVGGMSNRGDLVPIAINPNVREVWVAEPNILTEPDVSEPPEVEKGKKKKPFKAIKTVKALPSGKPSKDKKSLKSRKPRLAKKSTAIKSNPNEGKTGITGFRSDSTDEDLIGTVPFETIVAISPVRKPFPDFDPELLRFIRASLPGFVQISPRGENTLTVLQAEGDNKATLFQDNPEGDNRANISQTRTAFHQ